MEIPEEIKSRIFILQKNVFLNEELEKLLEEIYKQKIDEILFGRNKGENIRKIDHEIYQIVNQIIVGIHSDNEESIIELVRILKSANKYLELAISNADLKALLLFLSINCYLRIEVLHFTNYLKKKEKDKLKLNQKIVELLKNLKLETKIQNDAPYHEKEMKANAEKGVEDGSIEKVYEMILGMERGGRGLHSNYLLENLILFFFQFAKDLFIIQLNSLDHPMANVFYLQSFTKKELLHIASDNNLKNRWTLFEVMRQIIDKEQKDKEVLAEDKNALASCLSSLFQSDFSFYKQSILFLHRSNLFNSSLGKQLKELNEGEIMEVINDVIPIDKTYFNIYARTMLLEVLKVESNEKLKLVLRLAYNKWHKLFLSISDSDESYQSDLLLTDFASFIIEYFIIQGGKMIKNNIEENINKLIWINSEWFLNGSQYDTRYNLYLTELYLLSFAYKHSELSNPLINKLFAKLRSNFTGMRKTLAYERNPFEIIEDNITPNGPSIQ